MAECPKCGKEGVQVEKITVANHSKETCWPLGDEQFYMCENPDCDVVYYNASMRKLRRSDARTRVTFKERSSPRPLCYCKQVTEEDVV